MFFLKQIYKLSDIQTLQGMNFFKSNVEEKTKGKLGREMASDWRSNMQSPFDLITYLLA